MPKRSGALFIYIYTCRKMAAHTQSHPAVGEPLEFTLRNKNYNLTLTSQHTWLHSHTQAAVQHRQSKRWRDKYEEQNLHWLTWQFLPAKPCLVPASRQRNGSKDDSHSGETTPLESPVGTGQQRSVTENNKFHLILESTFHTCVKIKTSKAIL